MSQKKKTIRAEFRRLVLDRDGNRCRVCGWNEDVALLDPHHIQNRNLLPNGGYVKENGISVCPRCHMKAEVYHQTGTPLPGFSMEELYSLVGSSLEMATRASKKLG
jgi:hypothetical protein